MATRLEDADLTEGQRLLLRALAGSPLRDAFYLTGGSNLAGFRFRHRRSDDLDLFTDGEVPVTEVLALLRSVPGATVEGPDRRYDRYRFHVSLPGELIRLEFTRYPFPAVGTRETTEEGLRLDDPADIAANKVLALIERREGKDLVDLWKLTGERGGTALRNAIADAERKFGTRGLRYGLQGALVAAASAAAPRLHEPHDFDAARTWARDAAQRLARESLDEDQGKA
jgi:predicted nucleotidyltransferase component of viral defense system